MLHELGSPGEMTAEELHAAYRAALAAVVADVGTDALAADTGIDSGRLAALVDDDREPPELTLEEATAVLAATADATAEEMTALARDALLMGMSNAVLDVEALAARLDADLEPREIQSKVEGRFPMTLREFARIHAHLQSRTRGGDGV